MNLPLPSPLKRRLVVFGLAVSFLLTSSSQALNFTWQFVNSSPPANLGSDGDVIAGTILGLNEGWNFQNVTVTFDSVNGGAPSDGIGPQNWFSAITVNVIGGAIQTSTLSFSNNNGVAAVFLSGSAADFVSSADWSAFYSSGSNEVRFSPLAVPDGGITLMLLGLGLSGLAIGRRFMRA